MQSLIGRPPRRDLLFALLTFALVAGFAVLPFALKLNSWFEWANPLYFTEWQQRSIEATGSASLFVSTPGTGVFYPYFVFYGPGIYALLGALPISSLRALIGSIFLAFFAAGASGYLVARSFELSLRWALAIGLVSLLYPWNFVQLYPGGNIAAITAYPIAWLGVALIFRALSANNVRYAVCAGIAFGVLPYLHFLTAYFLAPILILLAIPCLFLIEAAGARRKVKYLAICLASATITALPIAVIQVSWAPLTNTAGSGGFLLEDLGILENLWLATQQAELLAPILGGVFVASAVIYDRRQFRKQVNDRKAGSLKPSSWLLLAGPAIAIPALISLILRNRALQGIWEAGNPFTTGLQGPSRFNYLSGILLVIAISYLLRRYLSRDSSWRVLRSPVIVALLLILLITSVARDAKIALSTKARDSLGSINVSDVERGHPPPSFLPPAASVGQMTLPNYRPLNGEVPRAKLSFPIGYRKSVSVSAARGRWMTNVVMSPAVTFRGAQFVGTAPDGRAVIEVSGKIAARVTARWSCSWLSCRS